MCVEVLPSIASNISKLSSLIIYSTNTLFVRDDIKLQPIYYDTRCSIKYCNQNALMGVPKKFST